MNKFYFLDIKLLNKKSDYSVNINLSSRKQRKDLVFVQVLQSLPKSLLDQLRICEVGSLYSRASVSTFGRKPTELHAVGTNERNFAAQRQQVSQF